MKSDNLPPTDTPHAGEEEHIVKSDETMELPDYVDESISLADASPSWFANPKNWRRIFLALLLIPALMLVPSIYRTIKSWRAEQILVRSASVFASGDDEQGISLMKQALALSPGSDSVQRAVELYNARIGDTASLQKILERMRAGTSGTEELLGIAELEARQGKNEIVQEAIQKLPSSLSNAQFLRLSLIQALLKFQNEGPSAAAELTLRNAGLIHGEESARLRNQAALYLLSEKQLEKRREGIMILLGVMRERTAASLASARMLGKLALRTQENGEKMMEPEEMAEVLKTLPALPQSCQADVLLSADLEMRTDPSSREEVVKRLFERYQNGSRQEMLGLARWLNGNGLPEKVVLLAGGERPNDDTDWLLVVLDAESALQHWTQIEKRISSPAGAGIPEAVRHLFLARVAATTGNTLVADEEWRNVNGSLQREKPEILAYIAAYEERIGALNQAVRTYREMANRMESHVQGLVGLIRSQPSSATAESMIPLYEELIVASPELSEAVGDLAYLRLLKNQNIQESLAISEKLLGEQPNSLARISAAALGRLKNGDVQGAASLYEGKQIDWATAPPPWKAVRVAVLCATNNHASAAMLRDSFDANSLRPEERELLKGIK